MVNRTMLGAVILVAMIALTAAAPNSGCSPNKNFCKRNEDCCGSCCHQSKCATSVESCRAVAGSPCSYTQCDEGKECYLEEVQCVQAPCPSIPACRSKDNDYN